MLNPQRKNNDLKLHLAELVAETDIKQRNTFASKYTTYALPLLHFLCELRSSIRSPNDHCTGPHAAPKRPRFRWRPLLRHPRYYETGKMHDTALTPPADHQVIPFPFPFPLPSLPRPSCHVPSLSCWLSPFLEPLFQHTYRWSWSAPTRSAPRHKEHKVNDIFLFIPHKVVMVIKCSNSCSLMIQCLLTRAA